MAKAKGKEKIVASEVPAETEEGIASDATAEPTPSEPVKMEEAPETTPAGSDKPEEADQKSDESENEEGDEDAAVDTEMTPAKGENKEEGDGKEEIKGDKKADNASNKKGKKQRRRKKKAASGDASDKKEGSAGEKDKKFDGIVFMCNSKTKKDCFEYKVMGLPEGKKDVVAKINKGMRLFLFDFDLKVMHGIYKASSAGGYNLEPEAFKSGFPSQVRFTVLKECNPLPEEKFKAAIKSNYFGKNKFNPLLSKEQVNDLFKLFVHESKTPVKAKRSDAKKEQPSAGRDKRKPRDSRPNQRPFRRPAYPRESYALAPPRQVLVAPPPLSYAPPAYAAAPPSYGGYERVEYHEPPVMYARDPYSSYRDPAPYREPLYPASMSSGYAPPPPPHYRY